MCSRTDRRTLGISFAQPSIIFASGGHSRRRTRSRSIARIQSSDSMSSSAQRAKRVSRKPRQPARMSGSAQSPDPCPARRPGALLGRVVAAITRPGGPQDVSSRTRRRRCRLGRIRRRAARTQSRYRGGLGSPIGDATHARVVWDDCAVETPGQPSTAATHALSSRLQCTAARIGREEIGANPKAGPATTIEDHGQLSASRSPARVRGTLHLGG
jgi:hypothetical protein